MTDLEPPGAEGRTAVRVWIDPDLCTGDGLCTDHCPEVFVLLEDGISYVQAAGRPSIDPSGSGGAVTVPRRNERAVIDAALDCPGECIFLDDDPGVTHVGHERG